MKKGRGMNAKFTMLFTTKTEREIYKRMAREQDKSLGKLIRELLGKEYDIKYATFKGKS